MKNNVYKRNLHTVDELKQYITDAFIEIDANHDLRHAVCHRVHARFEECCNIEEGHFKYLRD